VSYVSADSADERRLKNLQ